MHSPRLTIKSQFIWLCILTPVVAFCSYTIILVILLAFISNNIVATIFSLLVSISILIAIWARVLTKYINRNTEEYAVFKVAEIISTKNLTPEVTKSINASEGWSFDERENVRLNPDQIEKAFAQSRRQILSERRFLAKYRLGLALLALLMALYCLAGGTLHGRGGNIAPLTGMILCLFIASYLVYCHLKDRK
jgi:ABC-type transport system involved in cytochrome bd biosynthesis fused ATPase/permease subunit